MPKPAIWSCSRRDFAHTASSRKAVFHAQDFNSRVEKTATYWRLLDEVVDIQHHIHWHGMCSASGKSEKKKQSAPGTLSEQAHAEHTHTHTHKKKKETTTEIDQRPSSTNSDHHHLQQNVRCVLGGAVLMRDMQQKGPYPFPTGSLRHQNVTHETL